MVSKIALFCAAACLAVLTIRDVFRTVVVPGESRGVLQIARRLLFLSLPIWKALHRRRPGLPPGFAPFILVGSFAIWMCLLDLCFGAMLYVLGNSFHPNLRGFDEALYAAGGSIITMGVGENPSGFARWIVLIGGFCGLGIMTLAITYLLEVQSGVTQRDAGILKLNTSSGDPPSAIVSLEYHAEVGCREVLPDILRGGRDWCAAVGQSHASHPSLIYFRSVGIGAGWPAALGTFLDYALITELLLDAPHTHGPAVLLGKEGASMARKLMGIIRLEPKKVSTTPAEGAEVARRLRAAGYSLTDYNDWEGFAQRRQAYAQCVEALADHLGSPMTPLLPGASGTGEDERSDPRDSV